jgi:hypothetical protein
LVDEALDSLRLTAEATSIEDSVSHSNIDAAPDHSFSCTIGCNAGCPDRSDAHPILTTGRF